MKLGFVAAGSAFLLSVLVGLVSGAGFLAVIVRAVFFAALFFGLFFGGRVLVSRFLPELVGQSGEESPESEEGLGSRIDVVVGDEEAGIVAAAGDPGDRIRARADAEAEEAEEIEAFMPNDFAAEKADAAESAGLDLGSEGRYTETQNATGAFGPPRGKRAEPALPPGLIDDVDVLPDLDSMSDSFVSPLMEDATEGSSGEPASRSYSAPRAAETGGDFDPREMAAAIQTILKRDQKG